MMITKRSRHYARHANFLRSRLYDDLFYQLFTRLFNQIDNQLTVNTVYNLSNRARQKLQERYDK